jgi:hypothetical protein
MSALVAASPRLAEVFPGMGAGGSHASTARVRQATRIHELRVMFQCSDVVCTSAQASVQIIHDGSLIAVG